MTRTEQKIRIREASAAARANSYTPSLSNLEQVSAVSQVATMATLELVNDAPSFVTLDFVAGTLELVAGVLGFGLAWSPVAEEIRRVGREIEAEIRASVGKAA